MKMWSFTMVQTVLWSGKWYIQTLGFGIQCKKTLHVFC